jgi:hypothetical protein
MGLANVDTAVSELLNGGADGIGPELARFAGERAAALTVACGYFWSSSPGTSASRGRCPGQRSQGRDQRRRRWAACLKDGTTSSCWPR